jgi:hypothetical protein
MHTLRRILIAGSLVGSMAVMTLPAAAGGVPEGRCCGWFAPWAYRSSYPVPAYYGGPSSGATYVHYYGSSYWGRPHWRHRAHAGR